MVTGIEPSRKGKNPHFRYLLFMKGSTKMNIFTKHPQSIGESYFKHLQFATVFGIKMIMGGLACLLHGIFPFVFQSTGSRIILELHTQFTKRNPPKA
jgi:hypothetical protein